MSYYHYACNSKSFNKIIAPEAKNGLVFCQLNLTGVTGFWVVLEFWLECFQDFAWVLSFFKNFPKYSKKVPIFSNFWIYLRIKMLLLGAPLSFPLKMEFSFSLAPTQLNYSCRIFFWIFLNFFRIFLEFFWACFF